MSSVARDCRISIAVHEETRDDWKDAAEDDPQTDSMAQLIRIAVAQYLNDTDDTSSTGVPDGIEEQLSDLAAQHHDITRTLNELRGQSDDIHEAVTSSVDPETEQLANDVFDLLPSESDVTGTQVVASSGPDPGTIDWLNDRLQAPTYRIRAALDYLQESTYAVQHDDDQYFKEV